MKDFDEIMEELLSRVPDEVDPRVGGIIYTALAPIAAQLAGQQVYLDTIRDATMLDTAAGDDLTRRAAENGVNRSVSTFAVRKGIFSARNLTKTDVPLGARFGAEGVLYTVTKKLLVGEFELTCETAGIIGNRYFGAILPIDSVQNLGSATLADVLVSGEDRETDEQLRTRYYSKVNKKAFGGNVAQYEQEVLALDGVDA